MTLGDHSASSAGSMSNRRSNTSDSSWSRSKGSLMLRNLCATVCEERPRALCDQLKTHIRRDYPSSCRNFFWIFFAIVRFEGIVCFSRVALCGYRTRRQVLDALAASVLVLQTADSRGRQTHHRAFASVTSTRLSATAELLAPSRVERVPRRGVRLRSAGRAGRTRRAGTAFPFPIGTTPRATKLCITSELRRRAVCKSHRVGNPAVGFDVPWMPLQHT